jgi:alkylation response protein AidB-like acyl-CoA dehydrogenase
MTAARVTSEQQEALTVAGIRAAITPVLTRLADSAREREGTREYSYDEVRELREHRITLTGIPARDGGAGGTIRDVADLVIAIARADSNVAQALRPSFLAAHAIVGPNDVPNREHILERLRAGDLFTGTSNERGGAAGGVATRLYEKDNEFRIAGEKYYSTGGLYAQWFGGSAVDDDGRVVRFTVPADREGVERHDDFDAIGQRLTASGTTRLHDVRVEVDEIQRIGDTPPPNPWQGTFAQLYLSAVEAGIAAAALDDALWFARTKARPIKHSSADRAVDDPYVRHVVGEIAARANAARAVVLVAAEAIGQVLLAPAGELRDLAASAAVNVAEAQYVAAESALRAAELIFDVGGGSATDRKYAFDRHWRNARTIANHNPRNWKMAVAGGYHLVGEEPPTSGLF